MTYRAPLKDMLFDIRAPRGHRTDRAAARLRGGRPRNRAGGARGVREAQPGVVAPLNADGDRNPSSWKDGKVTTTPGFKDATKQYAEGGWQACSTPPTSAARACPRPSARPAARCSIRANLSFALCPLLTDGAIEALLTAGSDQLKAVYLEKLVSGEWTGTMNLTEPQAGSDLALVRTAPSRSPMAPTRCSAPRSSSPTASTTWRTTSSTWCWPACPARPRA
jgi:hypothetical protein